MQVHYDINNLPSFKNAVITAGTFDGVHTGHTRIIEQLKNEAAAIQGETVIITFYPHPRKIISGKEVFILNTPEEKIELLTAKGIDHLVVVPFNEVFSDQSPEAYISDFLVGKFHPRTIIIGYDHKFGKGRKGDYHLVEEYGKKYGFAVKEIEQHIIDNVTISSTKIREALLAADIDTAGKYLGYDYFFEGLITEGNKLGRTIGYPTANLQIKDADKLVPGNGVYAVTCTVLNENNKAGTLLQGMMNIGVRPTVDGTKRTIEVNIFNFNEDIYGKMLRVYIKKYLRGEVKFNGLDELKAQLAKDKEMSLLFLQ